MLNDKGMVIVTNTMQVNILEIILQEIYLRISKYLLQPIQMKT